MAKQPIIDDVAFALVNKAREFQKISPFKDIESFLTNSTELGLIHWRDMASIAVQAYNNALDNK